MKRGGEEQGRGRRRCFFLRSGCGDCGQRLQGIWQRRDELQGLSTVHEPLETRLRGNRGICLGSQCNQTSSRYFIDIGENHVSARPKQRHPKPGSEGQPDRMLLQELKSSKTESQAKARKQVGDGPATVGSGAAQIQAQLPPHWPEWQKDGAATTIRTHLAGSGAVNNASEAQHHCISLCTANPRQRRALLGRPIIIIDETSLRALDAISPSLQSSLFTCFPLWPLASIPRSPPFHPILSTICSAFLPCLSLASCHV